MTSLDIFAVQFVLSLIVTALIARWYLGPWLAGKALHAALGILVLPHAFRHIGLTFLVPGAGVAEGMPEAFASSAGYGDLAAGVLAIASLVALRSRWALAIPLVWLFNVVGFVDLANALRQAEVVPYFLSTWYIPTFIVPVLIVTHVMIFARLVQNLTGRERSPARGEATVG